METTDTTAPDQKPAKRTMSQRLLDAARGKHAEKILAGVSFAESSF